MDEEAATEGIHTYGPMAETLPVSNAEIARVRGTQLALTLHSLLAVDWCEVTTQLANLTRHIDVSLERRGRSCID